MDFKFKPKVEFKEITSNIYRIRHVSEKVEGYEYDDIVTNETVIKAMKDDNIAVKLEDSKGETVWSEDNW